MSEKVWQSRKLVKDKPVEMRVIDGMPMCGVCSKPLKDFTKGQGTPEYYCPRPCHTSYIVSVKDFKPEFISGH